MSFHNNVYLCNHKLFIMRVVSYIYIIGVIVVLSMFTACGGKDNTLSGDIPEKMVRTHGDSIALAARFTGDFKRFLVVTDSLFDAGELTLIRAEGYRGVAYFQLGDIEKSVACLRRVLAIETPPAHDFWEYIHAGTNLVIILNSQRNYDMAMRTALRLIDMLKQVDNPLRAREMQTLYLCLGDTQMMLERHADAVKSYNEAYQWVLNTPNDPTSRPLAASFETLENIAVTHLNHQLDGAGIWVDRMDSLRAVYEKQPKADPKEVKIFRALVDLHRSQECLMRGQKADAARYYAQFMASDYGQSIEGRINGCEYLVAAHRYAEAADNYTELDSFIRECGCEYDLETIGNNLLPKLRANFYAGRKDSALKVALQIAEVYDTALIRQKRSESAQLAAIYDTQGKERQITEQRAQTRFVSVVSIAVGIMALLALLFAFYVYRQWRITQYRNRILARQITEAVAYKEQLRELKAAPAAPVKEESEPAPHDYHTLSEAADEAELFGYLRDLIENEQLFLHPDFSRQTLIDRTGLSKERIGAAFSQGGESLSLPAYIRELRLDFAVRMMNSQPDIAVEQVSQASGFTSADTFTRNFRAKYGMTPTTYKQTIGA